MRNRPLTLDERRQVREFYAGDYHDRSDYTKAHPWHRLIAEYRVKLARAVFGDLGRVLDAGCAGGEEVLEFRRNGIEAYGFDLCPELHDIAYPEARRWVRMGRMDQIPFSPEDRLRTLVSFDVFEHVPVDILDGLPRELRRLGITQVSCIIANDEDSEGHITIQDTEFYVELFARAGLRLMTELDEILAEVVAPVGWDQDTDKPVIHWYDETGNPQNGWNCVPGHLFFKRG